MIAAPLALLLAATAAAAQEGPAFDCAKAESSAEKLVCADAALAAKDRALAARYAAALAAAGGLDSGAQEAVDQLKATQRGWIKGRDECWKADDLAACVGEAYDRRSGELVATWMLEPAARVVEYRCGPDGRDRPTVYFFAVEPPAIRIERGDRVEVAILGPAASGARYEGFFGVSFWSKGDEATLEMPQGEQTTCRAP